MTRKTRTPRARRKPHNARVSQYKAFDELLTLVADEPRKATIAGRQVTITRTEALLRAMVDRAQRGSVRDMRKILQMMAKDPGLAANSRIQNVIFVNGAMTDV